LHKDYERKKFYGACALADFRGSGAKCWYYAICEGSLQRVILVFWLSSAKWCKTHFQSWNWIFRLEVCWSKYLNC